MKIKMLTDYQGLKKGQEYDLCDQAARNILASGNAAAILTQPMTMSALPDEPVNAPPAEPALTDRDAVMAQLDELGIPYQAHSKLSTLRKKLPPAEGGRK